MLEEKKLLTRINFRLFVEFVIHEIKTGDYSYGTLHWLPQSQICPVCSISHGSRYDFIGHLDTLEEDFRELSRRYPELGPFKDLINKRPNAAGGGALKTSLRTRTYFKQLDRALLNQLFDVYREDFQLFGFEFPGEFMNMTQP